MKSLYKYNMNIALFGTYFNMILDKIEYCVTIFLESRPNSDNVNLFTVFF